MDEILWGESYLVDALDVKRDSICVDSVCVNEGRDNSRCTLVASKLFFFQYFLSLNRK